MSALFFAEGLALHAKGRGHRAIISWASKFRTKKGEIMRLSTASAALSKLKKKIVDLHTQRGEKVPAHVSKIKFPKGVYEQVNRECKAKAEKKQRIEIKDGDRLQRELFAGLSGHTISTLYPALLLCTGRRTIELVHGSLARVKGNNYAALFSGQAKTNNKMVEYEIPLLAPLSIVQPALLRLQLLLGGKQTPSGVLGKFIHLASGIRIPPHGLRKIYVAIAFQLTKKCHSNTLPQFAAKVLGHSGMGSTPFYLTYDVLGITKYWAPVAEKVVCACGKTVLPRSLTKHQDSKLHRGWRDLYEFIYS